MIRLKDKDGRTIALRLWKRQMRTLARGTSGLVEVLDHSHTYRTGKGEGHNNTEAETGPAEPPLE